MLYGSDGPSFSHCQDRFCFKLTRNPKPDDPKAKHRSYVLLWRIKSPMRQTLMFTATGNYWPGVFHGTLGYSRTLGRQGARAIRMSYEKCLVFSWVPHCTCCKP